MSVILRVPRSTAWIWISGDGASGVGPGGPTSCGAMAALEAVVGVAAAGPRRSRVGVLEAVVAAMPSSGVVWQPPG